MWTCDCCEYAKAMYSFTVEGVIKSLCSDCYNIYQSAVPMEDRVTPFKLPVEGDDGVMCPKCESQMSQFIEHNCKAEKKSKDWLDVMKDLP